MLYSDEFSGNFQGAGMDQVILTIDMITHTAIHLFAVSILWIIIAGQQARRQDPREPEAKGRWGQINHLLLWPHREYALRKRHHWILWVNLGSAAIFLTGFLLMGLTAIFYRGGN